MSEELPFEEQKGVFPWLYSYGWALVIIIIVAIGIVMYFRRGTGGVLSNLMEKLRFGG